MPKSTTAVNLDLEDLLTSKGYDVTSLDSSGKQLPTADSADVQTFHFHRDGKDYGTVTVSIDGLKNMIVYYDDEIANSGVNEDDMDGDRGMNGTSWISLVKQLKKFAQRHQLGFVLKDSDRLRTDMKRRKQTEKELRESYDGIGFSVRSDILWPSTLFESTNPKESEEFSRWIEHFRETSPLPDTGNKCILAMCVMSVSGINIFYGVAKFIGETETHYILDNGHSGENEYAKKNQLVFNSRKSFEKFRMATTLKFSEANYPVNVEETSVMESFSGDKQRMKLNKMFEGADLKEGRVKELDMDLKDKKMSAEEFKKKYKMTRAEARSELSLKPKKVEEGSNDYFKRRKNEEDRIAGTKPPAKRKPGNTGNTDYQRRRNREKEIGEGVTEGLSKRDQKDVEAIKAAIARLESQLKHPNADKESIQQSIAHEKKRLALYGKDKTVAEGSLNEFAPGDSGDSDDRTYEYEVYQCNPNDEFDWIGGAIYKTNSMDKAHGIAYKLHEKHPDKAFMIWQERSQGSRGGYGIKDDDQDVNEGWKEKVGAGLTAAAMATGAGGVVLNPARPIGPKGQTVANPYPNKTTNTKSAEDDAWAKIEKRKAAEKKGAAKDNQTKLDEGYYGNRKMSYSDDTPQVKMIIKHNRQLEETDKRFRHIEKIFLETSDGERFGVPTNKPSRARMFARHIAEGGGYKDERWNHIAEINEDIDSLGGFIRATRSGDQFNESAQRMIGEAVDKYHELRETAKRLQGVRGYNSYFEAYQPAVKNDNDDDLLEVFKHSSVDSRIEKALPTLNKLGIRRGKLEEADMFEQWADSLIDESLDIDGDRQSEAIIKLLSSELPVGPNAEVAIAELSDVIEDEDLYARLRRTAAANPNNDSRPQIIAWMQEQDESQYRELLAKIEAEDEENSEDEAMPAPQVQPEEPQPEEPQPEEPQPEEPPSEPQNDETQSQMKETDDSLRDIKRLSGL